ncbi:MAG: FAD-dependent oxidoreductase [Tetragenococcus sp.]|nr:FAD-dependent oxidoreductase [Tetragenococcus sp.]
MDNTQKINAQAMGHNGPIDFEVSVNNNQVTDLEIKQHSETPGIFDQVADKLRTNVLENQSFEIDAISGATVMSEAILESADQAVKEEGVQLPNKTKEQKQQEEEVQADVVVIGGGEAGLVAASKALTAGKKVVLLEKNGYLGGATILNGSNVTATGSKTAEKIFGESAKKDSPEALAADVSNESLETNDENLTQVMTENIGDAIDFISDFAGLEYVKAQTQTPEHTIDRQIELPSSSSYELIKKVSEAFTKKGGQIFLDARVEHVLQDDDGKVTGVLAKGRQRTLTVYADAIILSSGGYGANLEMRGKESRGLDYYGPQTSTGDAYEFLAPLDLQTKNIGWYKVYPHGVEVKPGIAKLTTYASKKATDMGAIYVNRKGERIVNESDVYAKLRNAVLKQPDKVAFLVMDKRTWQEFYHLLVLHDFTEEEIRQYFANDGKKSPIFVHGSLKEVAQKAGINASVLRETLKNYERYAARGNDEEFGRNSQFLHRYEGDELYVVEQRDRFATTLGGFVTGADLKLRTKDGKEVSNLWGAGEVIGGANGHDSMPSMMNTWSISSGFVAANNALLKLK